MCIGNATYLAPKKNTRVKESDPDAWKEMVTFARENTGEWEKIYHLRSYVEAIFSAIIFFEFFYYDTKKPGILSRLGVFMDDAIGGLIAGCMSKMLE